MKHHPLALKAGDWGLKRALPSKATSKTSTPTIRLRKDIDTESHIADFESAADHVVTLNKWQNVNPQVVNTPRWGAYKADRRVFSVFHSDVDNTTSSVSNGALKTQSANAGQHIPKHLQKALKQLRKDQAEKAAYDDVPMPPAKDEPRSALIKQKRWRYEGPWLAGMSNLEFDTFLQKVTGKEMAAKWDDFLISRVEQQEASKAKDLEEAERRGFGGDSDPVEQKQGDMSSMSREERLYDIKRKLRSNKNDFAMAIAEFLDLPDGPSRPGQIVNTAAGGEWNYARKTGSTPHYSDVGPPRTHPSAGFSYTRSIQYARNDPKIGPAVSNPVLPARLLKDGNPADGMGERRLVQNIGVGGLLVRNDAYGTSATFGTQPWRPAPGGQKFAVKLYETSVQQDGSIEIGAYRAAGWDLHSDNVPYNKNDYEAEMRARRQMPEAPSRLQQLDQPTGARQYRKAAPVRGLDVGDGEDPADLLGELTASLRR